LRKISMSIQLTDGSQYDGGDIEIHGPPLTVAPRSIGSVVVFPSYALHRVTTVTRGVRHSLVVWAAGPPFR
jgi:PKHD-type hydroxylase